MIGDDMLYLSGQIGTILARPHPDLGVMANPRSLGAGQIAEIVRLGIRWAADNDAFTCFSEERWRSWLASIPPAARALCLFAAVPDVVGDAVATRERFDQYAPFVREQGYPVAYVAQDGFDPDAVPWPEIDWLFIGGTTDFKRSERGGFAAIGAAKRRGLPVHVGRVNGGGWLRRFAGGGADSADGTKIRFGPDVNYPIVRGWVDRLSAQPVLELLA